ncbi:hypothetical protein [Sphingobium nicotianae]|uniref:Uncharacterized protein n=1 Tax=Sphingobium nicotianae TaxID=2782607 RepID=A0A9X1DFE4_9SPHN|nr:hypothetical protein [Sphingobium nicotianae]MBT2188869.1 hypothetical protein [Sphingobium nicotianae]
MNGVEMIVAIVAIVSVASIVRAKMGIVRTHKGEQFVDRYQSSAEADRLREEVKQLKERVAVLERLATDSSTALDREFEKLKQIDRN